VNDTQLFLRSVRILLDKNSKDKLVEFLKRLHPADIADVLDRLPDQDKYKVFAVLDTQVAAEVIAEANNLTRDALLDRLGKNRLTAIVDDLESDDAADLMQELTDEKQDAVLNELPKNEARRLRRILKYPEGTAGSIMQFEYLAVDQGMTVDEALKAIRSKSKNIEDIHNVFVTQENLLVGLIPLHSLIVSEPKTRIASIMEPDVVTVKVDDDQEYVAALFRKYDLISLAVVDQDKRIVGRITVDDILEVVEEESTEDIYKLAGLSSDENVLDRPFASVRRRLPWLLINLATAFLAASVVNAFQGTISALVVLAVFMPIIAGMGGNAGTQSLTVMVRGIALGHVNPEMVRKILHKELIAALVNGITVGIILAIASYVWKGNLLLSMMAFFAMIITLLVAAAVGSMVPLILKALKIDPALASSVIVTTFTDVVGFLSFLGLASIALHYLA